MKIRKVIGWTMIIVGEAVQLKAVYELYRIAKQYDDLADYWRIQANFWKDEWELMQRCYYDMRDKG